MKVAIPPIKSQGIKTKLLPWIKHVLPTDFDGVWIEPFMGTGVVGFNLAPKKAIFSDTNPHLIAFYSALNENQISASDVKKHLNKEGKQLLEDGEIHYYKIRERFNNEHHPLDFLFLSRAGFNGMIRFNKKGGFNVPFCRKPNRFAKAYITKIVNQVDAVSKIFQMKDFTFLCQDFEKTVQMATSSDIVYCDPPYIGRHTDYFSGWDEKNEKRLFDLLSASHSRFILSTWHHNDFRENEYISMYWEKFNILTRNHFYHVGASEKNRNPMIEAIITNLDLSVYKSNEVQEPVQLQLLEQTANYVNG